MNPTPRILEILRSSDDPTADQVLAAGLPLVPPETQLRIVEILIQHGRDAGLVALPEFFDKLAPLAQALVLSNTARLFGALRATVRSSSNQTRLNVIEIIRRSRNPRLAYLAAAAIHDGATQIRMEAAVTLREMTRQHCQTHAETTALLQDAANGDESLVFTIAHTLHLLGEEQQLLLAALREALGSFESHHRTEVVEAAMHLAPYLEKELFQEGTLKRSKLTYAMLEIFGAAPAPHLASFAYIALGYPDLRRKIVQVFAGLRNSAFFTAFIRYHWLARDPAIRRNLVAIRTLAWLTDGFDTAFTLPPEVAAITPDWLVQLGIPTDQKVALLANFLILDNPEANRAALWALVRIDTPASTQVLTNVLDHDDVVVSAIAERELNFRGRRTRMTYVPISADRPPEWATLLHAASLSEDFDDFWNRFDQIPPNLARTAGPLSIQFVPGLLAQLQSRIAGQNSIERVRAIALVTALHLAPRFNRDIFNAANDPAPEVRAAAMKPLSQIADATCRRILERALSDESPTVQVAAIDAFDQMTTQKRPDMLLPKATSDEPAVRAAAVRALLRMQVAQAAQELLTMLRDPRVEHRCNALWVVDQLRLAAIAPRIEEIADKDPDARIARVAHHVHRRLTRTERPPRSAPVSAAASTDVTLKPVASMEVHAS